MSRVELEELYRRLSHLDAQRVDLDSARSRIVSTRFDKQLAFIKDVSRRKAAFCSRRAGKTDNVPADLSLGAIEKPGALGIYCAITRVRAKELIWEPMKRSLEGFGVGFRANESELDIRLEIGEGTHLRITGADKIAEAHKKRGDKAGRVRIDEAQLFPFGVLNALVTDVFGPTLEDVGGDLGLLGTPGEVCAGFWFGVTGNDPDPLKRIPGWSVHRWGVLDNPHVPLIHARILSGEIAHECGGEDSPTYQREWLGNWVRDTGSLFYRFNPQRNLHDIPETKMVGSGWGHALGWDIGLKDAMGMVVWAFHRNDPCLYEAASWKKSGALVDECAEKYREFAKRFDLVGQVADTGGAGALFVAEVAKRHGIAFTAAKKTEKAEHVRLFNDELLAGRIKLRRGSEYAEQIAVLPKVLGWDEEAKGKPAPEDPRFPNDIADSGLYGWRWAMAYLAEAPESKPKPGTTEWLAQEEQRIHLEDPDAQAFERGDWNSSNDLDFLG